MNERMRDGRELSDLVNELGFFAFLTQISAIGGEGVTVGFIVVSFSV